MIMEMLQILGLVWIGFILGVIVGWGFRPRWISLRNCVLEFSAPSSTSALVHYPIESSDLTQNLDAGTSSLGSCVVDNVLEKEIALPANNDTICSLSKLNVEENVVVTDEDLKYLRLLVERKDGGPPWKHMMDRSTDNMRYQAWQRDPETGPPQYCSKTTYEDATPELLRDFFWDDEFRLKWDDMLLHAKLLEECPATGTMIVHWIRKFPFFCSNREYIIGRRTWDSRKSYYSVTKGVPCLSIPRRDKPRRVDLYYSSWYIQAVESRKGDGQLSACEVTLFHHEDMGIPWEIAKFGVRQGMWGAVKNIERGFRAYQLHRASKASLSHHAFMAQINTKIDLHYVKALEGEEDSSEMQLHAAPVEKPEGVNIPKLLIVGGLVAIACSLNRELLTKTVIFGVARRFGNIGGRAFPRTN